MAIAPARTKVAVGTAVTTLTATFDEGTAVGTDHLLVAAVMWISSTATASSNWTGANVFAGGSNGSTNNHAWISLRGDGTTNSITVTFSASQTYAKIVLFAVPGYSSVTPTTALASVASGTTATTPTLASTAGTAIVFSAAALGAGSGGGWLTGWTNGYTNTTDVASDRFTVGWIAQNSAGVPPTSTRTWTTARVSRVSAVAYPVTVSSGDTTAPAVAITSPATDTTVSGTITVSGTASDNTAVTGVSISVGGVVAGSATYSSGTWSYSLDTTAYEDQEYVIRATASDAAGNTTSATISLDVSNSAPPEPTPIWKMGVDSVIRAYQGTTLVYGDPEAAVGEIASFGPNGTHWPDRTPTPTDTMDYEITASAATWSAISTAITTALAATPSGGKGAVWIPDGVLTGNGAGSSSTPVLTNLGTVGRDKRILVYPLNGWGSVTTSDSLRFNNLKGITIGGIDLGAEDYGVNVSACEDFALVRMRGIAFNITGVAGVNTKNIEFVELVTPTALLRDQDRWGWRTSSAAGGPISDISAIGCYIAPAYRNIGSDSHCDSWQLSGQSANTYGNILYKDCTVFASTNHAVQIGGGYGLTFRHMLIFGGTVTKRKYPVPSGGDTVPNGHAIGGGGQPYGCSVYDSTIIGNLSGPSFQEVQNSKTDDSNYNSIFAPNVGGWTYDTSLSAWTSTEIDAAAAPPDSARLADIWSDSGSVGGRTFGSGTFGSGTY